MTKVPPFTHRLMYSVASLVTISNLLANCVNLAAALSFCGQCELLNYYIEGVSKRLEEKSTELKTAMKVTLLLECD